MVKAHCPAHRVDLAGEVLEENEERRSPPSRRASYYNASSKAVSQLRAAQAEMGTAGVKVKKIFKIRWNCVYGSVLSVLREYPAILRQLGAHIFVPMLESL